VTAAPLPDGGVAVLRDLTETSTWKKPRDFIANVSHELASLTSIQVIETLLDNTSENGGPTREFIESFAECYPHIATTETCLRWRELSPGARFDIEPVLPNGQLH